MKTPYGKPMDDSHPSSVENRLETLLKQAAPRTPDRAKLNALYLEAKKQSLEKRKPTVFKKFFGYAVATAFAVIVLWRFDGPPQLENDAATVEKRNDAVAIELMDINDPKAIQAMVAADRWVDALNSLEEGEQSQMLAGLETAMKSPEKIREREFLDNLVEISSDELFEEPEFW